MSVRSFSAVASLVGVLTLAVLLSACQSKSNRSGDGSTSADTLSLAQAEALIDSESSATIADDTYKHFMRNQELFASDTAACNSGPEAFRDFVSRFSVEEGFRRSRTALYSDSYQLPKEIKTIEFIQRKPDEEGFFSAWRVMEADSVVFSTGWLNSEVAEEYTFIRRDKGLWYLVDYFNINSLQ